jgi:hypothetical protein
VLDHFLLRLGYLTHLGVSFIGGGGYLICNVSMMWM